MSEGYDFEMTRYIGCHFESILMGYLRDVKRVPVEDKTHDMQYQKAGIDLVVKGVPVDAKCDRWLHNTGNVALELVSNLGRGTVGAALSSRAERWCYGEVWSENGAVNLVCHYWSLPLLIQKIEQMDERRWQAFKTTTSGRDGGILYATVGLLVPLEWIRLWGQSVGYGSWDLSSYLASLQQA